MGRGSEAVLQVKNQSLSRIQCKLECEETWLLSDGDGTKKSTNGTWLYVDEPFEIYDNIVFKAGNLLFRVTIHT